VNYVLDRLSLPLGSFSEWLHKKALLRILTQMHEMNNHLFVFYQEIPGIDKEHAKKTYSLISKLQESVNAHNGRIKRIDYMGSDELKEDFIKLIRLVNRIKSRLHGVIHSDSEHIQTPDYIKAKIHQNSKKIVADALREKAYY
jgi:hypothetical protein